MRKFVIRICFLRMNWTTKQLRTMETEMLLFVRHSLSLLPLSPFPIWRPYPLLEDWGLSLSCEPSSGTHCAGSQKLPTLERGRWAKWTKVARWLGSYHRYRRSPLGSGQTPSAWLLHYSCIHSKESKQERGITLKVLRGNDRDSEPCHLRSFIP